MHACLAVGLGFFEKRRPALFFPKWIFCRDKAGVAKSGFVAASSETAREEGKRKNTIVKKCGLWGGFGWYFISTV